MKILKQQYRIITDNHKGFEVQKRLWYFPFWFEIHNEKGMCINTQYTLEEAEKLIEFDKTRIRRPKFKVVKTFKWVQIDKINKSQILQVEKILTDYRKREEFSNYRLAAYICKKMNSI